MADNINSNSALFICFISKIKSDIQNCLKQIEQEETTFARRSERLLEKYKEIYTISNYSYDDLIDRKIELQSSRENFMSIYLPIVLAVLSTFIFNVISKSMSVSIWDKFINYFDGGTIEVLNYIANQLLSIIFSVIIAMLGSPILSKQLNKFSRRYNRYNTTEFEMDIIDKILAKQFNLIKVEQEILDGYFGSKETKNFSGNENIKLSDTDTRNDVIEKQVESKECVDETRI